MVLSMIVNSFVQYGISPYKGKGEVVHDTLYSGIECVLFDLQPYKLHRSVDHHILSDLVLVQEMVAQLASMEVEKMMRNGDGQSS